MTPAKLRNLALKFLSKKNSSNNLISSDIAIQNVVKESKSRIA